MVCSLKKKIIGFTATGFDFSSTSSTEQSCKNNDRFKHVSNMHLFCHCSNNSWRKIFISIPIHIKGSRSAMALSLQTYTTCFPKSVIPSSCINNIWRNSPNPIPNNYYQLPLKSEENDRLITIQFKVRLQPQV